MSDGGIFQWKVQEIDSHRGPAGSYSGLSRPLPPPPKDMHWVLDTETREWRLEQVIPDGEPEATPVDDEDDDEPFVIHKVQPSDTFQGICLRYKITPTELRQANGGFSGTNLFLAPNPLTIPKKHKYVAAAVVSPIHQAESPSQKIQKLRQSCPGLAVSEAKCYLELNDWNVKEALLNARDDGF